MILNGVIALTSPNRSEISPNSAAFGADYVRVVEDTPTLSAAEMYRPKNVVFIIYCNIREVTENECVTENLVQIT